MEDIDKAQETAKTAAGNVGMTRVELDKANSLLSDYGGKREGLLKSMLSLLGQSDISSVDRDWRDRCMEGRDALSRLNDEIPRGAAPAWEAWDWKAFAAVNKESGKRMPGRRSLLRLNRWGRFTSPTSSFSRTATRP